MKKIKAISSIGGLTLFTSLFLLSPNALATDYGILHPYQSVRAAGMGGIVYTTGLYDENFFANPARATANPTWRVTLFDPTFEFSSNVPSVASGVSGNSFYGTVGAQAGQNHAVRFQSTMPAFYWAPRGGDGKWGVAVGLITDLQGDVNPERDFNISPQLVGDVGPAVTVARKFMKEDELSVGVTGHFDQRVSVSNYGFMNLIQGQGFGTSQGGEGAMVNFDTGATYQFHWHPAGMNISAAAAIDNILGGKYDIALANSSFQGGQPLGQPRTFNLGIAATMPAWHKLKNSDFALEIQDIGNNPNGSVFRLIHIGGETHFGVLALRLGIDQGYFCAGLGLNLRVFTVDFATYAQELGLNAGDLEDRRYALRLALQI